MAKHIDRAQLFGESLGAAERIAPGHFAPGIEQDHLARYRWASRWVRGRRVLDIACGTGYGAQVLTRGGARTVVGADRSFAALAFGMREFALAGACVDGHQLPFADATFDVVISMETIEHLADPGRFASELGRVLADGGRLMLSTPNLVRSGRDNPHHLREFTRQELTDLLWAAGLHVRAISGQHWRTTWRKWLRTPGLRRLSWMIEKPPHVTSLALPASEPLYFCVDAVRQPRARL